MFQGSAAPQAGVVCVSTLAFPVCLCVVDDDLVSFYHTVIALAQTGEPRVQSLSVGEVRMPILVLTPIGEFHLECDLAVHVIFK